MKFMINEIIQNDKGFFFFKRLKMLTQIIKQSVNKKSNLLKCTKYTLTHMKCSHYISLNKNKIHNNNATKYEFHDQ